LSLNSVESAKSDGTDANKVNKAESWKVASFCRCIYSEDNVEYEAQIKKLLPGELSCLVTYIGYNNEEKQLISNLKSTLGKAARQAQTREATIDESLSGVAEEAANVVGQPSKAEPQSQHSNRKRFVPPMPPPPDFFDNAGNHEDDALASMLMSWYMSGYHTGYYRALKLSKSQCSCKQENNTAS